MSKERLDGIKGCVKHDLVHNDGMMISVNLKQMEWLIEQAEQMRELEREYCKCVDSHTHVEMQNKRYREAIKEAIEEEEQNLEGYESNVYKILLKALEESE